MRANSYLVIGLVNVSLVSAVAGDWVSLFDGKSLEGWKASENASTFRVENGTIVTRGERSHLFYAGPAGTFTNFEFEVEVNAGPGANSGIYYHTRFQPDGWPSRGREVQINNSAVRHGDYLELKKTGSLYGIRNIYKQLAEDNEWFTMRIRVDGRRVRVWVKNQLLVDHADAAAAEGASGTFALQGHDPESRVSFRNLRARELGAAELQPGASPVAPDAAGRVVLELGRGNFPVVDLHTHLKGGLTLEEVLDHTRKTGINHGVAVNCGLGFSITNDAGIEAHLKELPGTAPVFRGMQAEGREWVTLFSPGAVAQFDYVLTDAMTVSGPDGKRMRLWIKEEVSIPDKQAFMELLVGTIENIFAKEPMDIYANPTFLPEILAGEYDTLWTPERQQRVIAAAAKHSKAIEINSRYRLPKADFIKAAKKAGVKFTLGTNNPDREILANDYGFQMVRECQLTWEDLWMPERKRAMP